MAMRISPDMPRSRIKHAARSLAWDSLSDCRAWHDLVDDNLFLDTSISDSDAQHLHRELSRIEVEEAVSPLQGRLLRWLSTAETKKIRAGTPQEAA